MDEEAGKRQAILAVMKLLSMTVNSTDAATQSQGELRTIVALPHCHSIIKLALKQVLGKDLTDDITPEITASLESKRNALIDTWEFALKEAFPSRANSEAPTAGSAADTGKINARCPLNRFVVLCQSMETTLGVTAEWTMHTEADPKALQLEVREMFLLEEREEGFWADNPDEWKELWS